MAYTDADLSAAVKMVSHWESSGAVGLVNALTMVLHQRQAQITDFEGMLADG